MTSVQREIRRFKRKRKNLIDFINGIDPEKVHTSDLMILNNRIGSFLTITIGEVKNGER